MCLQGTPGHRRRSCENAYPSGKIAYLCSVQMMLSKQCPDGQPRSPGVSCKLKVCVMNFANFERHIDRITPTFLLMLGMLAAFGTAGLGI